MARPIRIEYEGASYHVMARGNERRKIFRDKEDGDLFLKTLGEASGQFGIRVQAYCLMPNHYHLLISTPRGNLSQGMGWLQTTFTIRYNQRHRRSGHLFQGRFKAVLIEADAYAQTLIPYLHLNPVRSRKGRVLRLVGTKREMEAWPWSSHRFYAGKSIKPEWLDLSWLHYWNTSLPKARQLYRNSINREFETKDISDPWSDLKLGLVLGGEDLFQKVKEQLQKKSGHEEVKLKDHLKFADRAQKIRSLVEKESDPSIRLWMRARWGGERKVDLAREHGVKTGAAILERIKRLEKRATNSPGLKKRLDALEKELRIES